ncbi:hypothetical protein LOAG_06861 [Loa loa]|uniref:Uncharacterized protein n=1 Tax=Loa loa TaxID=7209 RepID=A0A1S0TX29_LOALO|nr:hypothetical protein LOAG_06861 [Loa loa]EFO21625.2 hypothetical protein LOAG_06861 [Loa loa]
MREVRKFKLDLSEKQEQEVDVDLDAQFDDIGNEAPVAVNVTPEVVSPNALQKSKQKSEGCKGARKEESTQSSLKKQRMPRKSMHSQLVSRITKDLQEKKQWEQPIGGKQVSF